MSTLFQPRKFFTQTSRPEDAFRQPWGTGQTPETDPTKKGWRVRCATWDKDLLIVGRRRQEGCATVRRVDGQYEVKYYRNAPAELSEPILHEAYLTELDHDCIGFGVRIVALLDPEGTYHSYASTSIDDYIG